MKSRIDGPYPFDEAANAPSRFGHGLHSGKSSPENRFRAWTLGILIILIRSSISKHPERGHYHSSAKFKIGLEGFYKTVNSSYSFPGGGF